MKDSQKETYDTYDAFIKNFKEYVANAAENFFSQVADDKKIINGNQLLEAVSELEKINLRDKKYSDNLIKSLNEEISTYTESTILALALFKYLEHSIIVSHKFVSHKKAVKSKPSKNKGDK